MENIPAQSETSHDVSHTRSRMSVIWNEKRARAQRLSIYYSMSTTATVIHSGYTVVAWKMCFCIWVTVWKQKKKTSLPFNTLAIDSSKTGHYQQSHRRLKHGKLISFADSIECMCICLFSCCCCMSRRQRTDTTALVNSDRAQIQIG